MRLLLREADTQGGRLLSLSIHPWLMGQPHRINTLDQLLNFVMNQDGVGQHRQVKSSLTRWLKAPEYMVLRCSMPPCDG